MRQHVTLLAAGCTAFLYQATAETPVLCLPTLLPHTHCPPQQAMPCLPQDWLDVLQPLTTYLQEVTSRFSASLKQNPDSTLKGAATLIDALTAAMQQHLPAGSPVAVKRTTDWRRLLTSLQLLQRQLNAQQDNSRAIERLQAMQEQQAARQKQQAGVGVGGSSSGPGELSAEGRPRHENDRVCHLEVSVAPTRGEVLCKIKPFLPPNRCVLVRCFGSKWHGALMLVLATTAYKEQSLLQPCASRSDRCLDKTAAAAIVTAAVCAAQCAPPLARTPTNRPGSLPHAAHDPDRAHRELHFRLLRHDVVGPVCDAAQAFMQFGGVAGLRTIKVLLMLPVCICAVGLALRFEISLCCADTPLQLMLRVQHTAALLMLIGLCFPAPSPSCTPAGPDPWLQHASAPEGWP